MSATNSARYRRQEAERDIPDGIISSTTKKTLPNPRISYTGSKSKGQQQKPKNQEKRKRAKRPQKWNVPVVEDDELEFSFLAKIFWLKIV